MVSGGDSIAGWDPAAGFASGEEARTVLERAFASADAEDGPALRGMNLSEEMRINDLDLSVLLAAGGEGGGRCIHWRFRDLAGEAEADADDEEQPRLRLSLDAAVANGLLQGRESMAVAIARGRLRVRGEARAALVQIPALRTISRHYLSVVRRDFPHLLITG